MARRFPLAVLAILVAAVGFAQPPKADAPPTGETPKAAGDLRKPQEQNAKLFRDLLQGLLALAQKLERSDKPEDAERAKTIRAALKIAEDAGVENQFRALIDGLGKGAGRLSELEKLQGQDAELAKALQDIVNILMTDDEAARLKAEIARLTEILKEVKDIKRREEIIRAMTEAKNNDAAKIAKTQADLARQTKDLADRMAGKKGGDGAGKPEDPKAEPKAEAKPGDNPTEPKPDTAEPKASEKDAKPGDAGAESKPGGEPKDAAAKPADDQPKPMAESRGKGDPKPPMNGDSKKDPPKADANEPKGSPDGKADGKPSEGDPKAAGRGKGSPPKGEQQAQSKGSPPPPGGEPGQPADPNAPPPKNQTPGRKSVQEAYPHQKAAEEDLNKNDRSNASKKETKAIEELAKAIEELEKRLKQLREEEMLKTLAALEARCNRMLAMQIDVYENTKAIHAAVTKNDNRKTTADVQKAQQQSTKEGDIVAEADKTLKLLASEGSAVAFANVLEEVRGDMVSVQRRLDAAYVDGDTQGIEENIIAMLKDMIAALKKAQQDIEANKGKPPPPGSNKPGNQKLIDLLAELRLIRAMQMQVNSRTLMYAKKYPGEQTDDPIIRDELRQVSTRQAKLQDMIQKIATQANQ